ncbi:MAG: adenine deaminase, partial [Deltaproteobacteria bacterium]
MKVRDLVEPQKMRELMRVALGDEKADLVVMGGDLVDVYTGELLRNHCIATKDKWIAYVGPEVDHLIGPQTEVIDASGKVVAPGFIDAHAHMVYYHSPDEFIRYAIKSGTTTIITEIMELAFPMGYEGLLAYIDALRDQPIRVL